MPDFMEKGCHINHAHADPTKGETRYPVPMFVENPAIKGKVGKESEGAAPKYDFRC